MSESKETCGIIVPRRREILGCHRESDDLPVCICPRNHFGPHVFRTQDGQLIAWEDDHECGCCEPGEDERCYLYWNIDEAEFQKYLSEGVLE